MNGNGHNRIAGIGATAPSAVQKVVDVFNPLIGAAGTVQEAVGTASGTIDTAKQVAEDAKQALADVRTSAQEAKQAVIGYGATTALLQAIIAGGVVFIAYQIWKANKRR